MNDVTSTEPLTLPVTTADKRALRHANTIVVRLYKGQATLEAYLRSDDRHNTTGFEQHHVIYCGDTVVTDYGRSHSYVPENEWHRYTGFASIGSVFSNTIRTLVDRIRVGGTMSVRWVRDNASDVTRDAGLVVDQVYLRITAPAGKSGLTPNFDEYLVAVSVSRRNSARMIQLDGSGA